MIRSAAKGTRTGGRWSSPDWSGLPNEIWSLIMVKLPLEDYIRCGSVCSMLFSVFRDLKQCSTQPRVPWLMLSAGSAFLRFFDMASNKVHKIVLPELFDSIILGSSEGWLIVVDVMTADLRLFNPFTRDQIPLPPTTTFPGVIDTIHDSKGYIKKYKIQFPDKLRKKKPIQVICLYFQTAFVTSSSCGYIVVVKYRGGHGLAFARAGDKAWIDLDLQHNNAGIVTGLFFKSLFYAMDSEGRVFTFDLNSNIGLPPLPQQVAPICQWVSSVSFNLEVSPESGELLQLGRDCYGRIKTFRLDQKAQKWRKTTRTLDGYSVFFREGAVFSRACLASKDFPESIKRDCIYFIDYGSLKVWDTEYQDFVPYCWTPQHRRELGDLITCCHIWIDPVISSFRI